MSKKLPMSPDMSYMLGVSRIGKEEPSISVASRNGKVVERFMRIAISTLKILPEKIVFEEEDGLNIAMFYNSKAKKLMSKALEEREHLFKYKNDYSGSYFAGLFDARGHGSPKGIMSGVRDMTDIMLLERLGFRVSKSGRVQNANQYLKFIEPYSATL
ncbi:MAG: hypothetical protein KGH94_03545 [Candidatus Micrarchaeota archaeon]|nr:hypothetical protein [Candidatus Micrarchaeota archaeon]